LKYRYRDGHSHQTIRAKTGSLSHISTLSGYCESHDKHVLAFSILINGIPKAIKPYRDLSDEITIKMTQTNVSLAKR
jgi:serine-type D-Ala-D-Ala carboxypeptidase/endopeptidase (penicillin-binding protein 4)